MQTLHDQSIDRSPQPGRSPGARGILWGVGRAIFSSSHLSLMNKTHFIAAPSLLTDARWASPTLL